MANGRAALASGSSSAYSSADVLYVGGSDEAEEADEEPTHDEPTEETEEEEYYA